MIKDKVQLSIIGGGAAGLAAAIAAKKEGIDSIRIFERNECLGGILPQCIHTGFGQDYFKENLTGPEYLNRFVETIQTLNIEYKVNTSVLDLTPRKEILSLDDAEGLVKTISDAVVLAMGCRERSRGALFIPGTRPAGIFTAGTAQRLMDIEGYVLGRKILIIGSGDIGLIMARRFAMEGAEVLGVAEINPYPGGLERNLQILRDFGIPLYLNSSVIFINGKNRIESVLISKSDNKNKVLIPEEETIECDTLIMSVGLIPENEISRKAGVMLDTKTGGPYIDENMETSVENIFACGNVVHVHDLVDHVSRDAEEAGSNAAKRILEDLPLMERKIHLKTEGNLRYIVPQIISATKPVTLYARVKEPVTKPIFKVGKIIFKKHIVRPSELANLNLSLEKLKSIERWDDETICSAG